MNHSQKITNSKQNIPLVNFPYEVLVFITRHLECSDILSMSRACKVFHNCVYEDVLNSGSERRILGRKLCLYKKNGNIKELLIGFYFIGVAAANIDKYTKSSFGYNFIVKYSTKLFTKYAKKQFFEEKQFSIMDHTLMLTHVKSRSLVEKHEAQKKLSLLKTLKNLTHVYHLNKEPVPRNVLGLFPEIIVPKNKSSGVLRETAFSLLIKIADSHLNEHGDGILELAYVLKFCSCKKLKDKIFSVLIETAKGQDSSECATDKAISALAFISVPVDIDEFTVLDEAIESQTRALSALIKIAKGEDSTQFACACAIRLFFKKVTGLTRSTLLRSKFFSALTEVAKGKDSSQYACAYAIEQLHQIASRNRGGIFTYPEPPILKEIRNKALSCLIEIAKAQEDSEKKRQAINAIKSLLESNTISQEERAAARAFFNQ